MGKIISIKKIKSRNIISSDNTQNIIKRDVCDIFKNIKLK